MTELHTFLVEHPVGLLFLVVGIGYLIGKVRIGSFDLGSVSGVLFASLALGYYGYQTWGTSCLKVSCSGVPGFFFLRLPFSGGFQSIFS